MKCLQCGAAAPAGAVDCPSCGAPLGQPCPSCGAFNPIRNKFCGDCGGALKGAEAAKAGPAALAASPKGASQDPERRHLTILFGDLVGSTEIASRLDPEDLRDLMAAYYDCVGSVVRAHSGFLAKYLGDGVLLYFGYPTAREDDPESAVRAGLAIVQAVQRLEWRGERLCTRIGIATGVSVVGDLFGPDVTSEEHGVVGETPNMAARLQALAPPNGVIVEENTRRLVGDLFEFRDLGRTQIKGFKDPIGVFEVVAESGAISRFEALRSKERALVGRRKEVELLRSLWGRARSGEGQVVLISGEPGIGKSRLVASLQDEAATDNPALLRYFCAPHRGGSALYPVISHLERAAGFTRDDSDQRKFERIENLLAPIELAPSELAAVAEFLNLPARDPACTLSPQQRRDSFFEVVLRQVRSSSRTKPVLVVWEDLHWSDPTALELLTRVIDLAASLRVLVVATFRPEFAPSWAGPHVTAIALARLNRSQNAALVARVAGKRALPPDLIEQIVERTDGVPLFVEELTKAVLEASPPGGQPDASGQPPPVPATLQASLMARLDRLSWVREIAQVAAVIGREFSHDLLAAVTGLPDERLRLALARLNDAELVFARGQGAPSTYAFKHALLQDAAYGSLLKGRRREIHGRIVSALEAAFGLIVETQPEFLAHHCTKAGLIPQAVRYHVKAAHRALTRSAAAEAALHAGKGLGLVRDGAAGEDAKKLELDLELARGQALVILKGEYASETGDAFFRARAICGEMEEPDTLFQVLDGLCVHHFSRRDLGRALATSRELLALGERKRDRQITMTGLRAFGSASFLVGDFGQAKASFRELLALYRPEEDANLAARTRTDPEVTARSFLSLALVIGGYADQAFTECELGIRAARELRHPASLAFALRLSAFLRAVAGDWLGVLQAAEEVVQLSEKHRFPVWRIEGGFFQAWAAFQLDRNRSDLERMRESLDALAAGKAVWPFFLAAIGSAEALAREDAAAERSFSAAAAVASEHGERWYEAEIIRQKAEVRRRLSNTPSKLAPEFETALDLARCQGAKLWELRAAVSLARAWRDDGEDRKGRELLAPIYASFTEGFDTGDLASARSVLELLDEGRAGSQARVSGYH